MYFFISIEIKWSPVSPPDYLYSGKDNRLKHSIKSSYYITCNFNLQNYPFDRQTCAITFSISNLAGYPVKLQGSLKDQGSGRGLTEYVLSNTSLALGGKGGVVFVRLQRKPTYHLVSTYIPVLLLDVIGYGTLFISADDFQVCSHYLVNFARIQTL